MNSEQTRRAVLGGIASATTALAGCTGSPGQGTATTAAGGPFADVSIEKQSLVVALADGSSLDRVNVISPNGEQFASTPVATGAEQVSINLGVDYHPGEHRIVAVKDDKQAGATTLTIEPDLRIVEVGVGANHMDEMPKDLEWREKQTLVVIENRGNGPSAITKLLVLGDVPNPTKDLRDRDSSGIYDSSDGYGHAEKIVVGARSQVQIYSTTMPFLFGGDKCKQGTGTGRIVLEVEPARSKERQFKAQYTKNDQGCSSEIVSLL